jgi:hypothetical protein
MSLAEIRSELSQLVSGRVGIADGVLPPLVFVAMNAFWGLTPAAVLGIGSALLISGYRLARGRPIRFALAGLVGTALAALLALRSGSSAEYFLPGIVSGAITTLAIVVSAFIGKPFLAWTSWLTRGWPLGWYWHPQVRPAYSRAGWLWAGFFGMRTGIQWRLYSNDETVALGITRVLLGWPALVLLLVLTYTLGRRWLVALGGPSVEEFETESPPPWSVQPTGF